MATSLSTNIASLRAQRETARISKSLSDVQTRLASGLRINRAVDDAAGLAIASSLNVQARIYGQSIRNINDGISALSIANGATDNLSQLITRMRELAAQSANGTLSDRQRTALDKEAQALRNEYIRIVDTTSFNGIRLIHHDTAATYIQAGSSNPLFRLSIDSANLATGVSADGTFGDAITVDVSQPYQVVAGDFNNDGIQDLASAGASGSVTIQAGNGDGTFSTIFTTTPGSKTYGLTAADFDHDGNLDVSTIDDSGNVTTFLGSGDGTITQAWTDIIDASGHNKIQNADIDGDGILDIAMLSFDNQTLTIGLGNGDGTFNLLGSQVFNNGTSMSFGDFNGDNILDVVIGWNIDSSAQVLFGVGDGTFDGQTGLNTNTATNVAVGDFNNDGILDIVSGDGTLDLLLGDGAGNFTNVYTSGVNNGNLTGLVVGDFNNDGFLDVAGNNTDNLFSIFYGDGQGHLSDLSTDFQTNTVVPTSIIAVDLNNDGVLDLVSGDDGDNTINITLGNHEITSYLNAIDLSTKSGALAAMQTLSDAQTNLARAVGVIGSEQSRLFTALSNVQSTRENYLNAASRITDADVAEESANFLRLQIMQRAASTVMTQANQQPALALQLIKNGR